MNFTLFVAIGIVIFALVLLGGRKYRSTALYALAIGGVVNSNFFNSTNYPIDCFGLPFGIDGIIYTLFIFCVIVMLIGEGRRSAYLLAISGVIAILFSAVMQLISELLSRGITDASWITFAGFMISAFSSVVAITVTIEVVNRLKEKLNAYLLIIIGTVIATVINSGIYFPLAMLVGGTSEGIGILLLTSFIGKAIALAISLLTYFFLTLIDKKAKKE